MPPSIRPINERFISHVDRSGGPDACWPWLRAKHSKTGHGYFKVCGKMVRAHRFAYELWVGPIPEGMFVCHSCDNPPCCNPAHLWPGTPDENTQDKITKGRARYSQPTNRATGERNGTAKLAEEQVASIRKRYQRFSPNASNARQLAEEFGVCASTIQRIVNGSGWRS